MIDRLPSLLRENPSLLYGIIAVLFLESVVALLLDQGILAFDKHIGLAVFGGLPVLLLTLIQLYTGSIVQRASLVKDLAAKIYTDEKLAETFHSLVYTYDDKTLKSFLDADKVKREEMNAGRVPGSRLFDPATVSGTEEERRLDALLGYLDIIAYHHHRRLIHMRDIAGVLGYHLAIIGNRQAITAYRASIPEFWQNSMFGQIYGTNSVPLRYLDKLLKDYQAYCERQNRSAL